MISGGKGRLSRLRENAVGWHTKPEKEVSG